MNANSKFLSRRQIKGLTQVGQALVPGGQGFPSFVDSGCVTQIDRVLDTMPLADLNDLRMLLLIFGFLPAPLARALVVFIDVWAPTRLAPGVARLIRIGLRGLAFTLYYGDPEVLSKLGYKVGVVPLNS